MENEILNVLQPEDEQNIVCEEEPCVAVSAPVGEAEDLNSATLCTEDEGLSVCICENDEEVTMFEQDDDETIELDDIAFDEDIELESDAPASCPTERIVRKCRKAKEAFDSTVARLANDWNATGGNPHIKYTRITQVDIYRNADDETPIDSFRTEQKQSFSARSLAALSLGAFVLAATAESLVKNILKK